jgi:hypothetical protein
MNVILICYCFYNCLKFATFTRNCSYRQAVVSSYIVLTVKCTYISQHRQAKMQWVQDPSQSNVDNLNNVRYESSRPMRRWKDNINMYLQGVEWGGGMDWIDLAQDRDRWRALVNAVMNLRVP